jgi:two-component system CheB/CheR fusion protein
LGEDVETHLYRITQEAVQNAVSHGRAGRISITLSFVKDRGTLVIRDNGTGIKADHNSGNGMHTMDYRARLIGASLSVRPGHQNGTRVACAFSRPSPSGTHSHV